MKIRKASKVFLYLLLCCAVVFTFGILAGCQGKNGAAGITTGTVTGTVTAATGGAALDGVTVTASSSGGTTTTDSSGNYTLTLPAGAYTLTFTRSYYTTGTASANVIIGGTTPLNVSMAEADSGKPTVTVAASGQNVGYNTSFTLTANATDPNGDTVTYSWSGATGTNTSATATTPSLATSLSGTTSSTDPGGYVSAYTQESRMGILPITADTRGSKAVTVTVNDGHGKTNTASVTVYAAGIQTGNKAVALGLPVYLNSGSTSTATTWTVAGPATSPTYSVSTTLADSGRNANFTPDEVGSYVVTATTGTSLKSMTVYAGKWVGVITGTTYTSKKVTEADGMWYGWAPSSTQSSYTYTNWPVLQTDLACAGCHNNTTAPDKFTPWKQTAHATFFARGLENITSNSNSCTTCHTVGYDVSATAANDGYDDIAKAEGFNYVKATGAWSAMTNSYSQSARRANIQCENCHGPQDTGTSGAHSLSSSGSSSSAVRVSYSAEVCGTCHASGTGHHFYSEWKASGHSGAPGSHSGTNCGRCHEAQGFVRFQTQLAAGNPGLLASADWDSSNNYGVTCSACHDPHSDANEHQLRLYDSLPKTMAGYSPQGLGKGAICVSCHNIRDGVECLVSALTATGLCTEYGQTTYLHEDATTGGKAPETLDRAHYGPQGDVLMGRNAYFMGSSLPMLSKHASIEDSCVGCHMELNPETHLSHGAPAVNSHRFAIQEADAPKLCANCHSSSVNGEGLKANVEALIDTLGAELAGYLENAIKTSGTTTIYAKTRTGSPTAYAAASVNVTYAGHGGFNINGQGGSSGYRLPNITTSSDAVTTPLIAPSDDLVKGLWNLTLVELDSSYGIHNPTFVMGVLTSTINRPEFATYRP